MKTPAETCVLVVDDDPSLCDAVAFAVERKGYRILKARSGNDAAKLLRTFVIDIVISDIRMNDGDGRELLKFMRELNPSLPVMIFMTGFSDVSEKEALESGARCVFRKPFERLKLIAELDKVIGYERPAKKSAA
jgi:DNA-binding response OmpR family regulator